MILCGIAAEADGAAVEHGFDHALLADETLGLKLVENPGQLAGLLFNAMQLAFEFGAGVLAAAEQAQSLTLE